jgi:uncharacterized protein (DUF1810 family)
MTAQRATDPFNLERFLEAQAHIYASVIAELRVGEKQSHWMWFIFPQLSGLGRSSTAREFAISGPNEARAYLQHLILGPRLLECTEIVIRLRGRSLEQIFGSPDDMKFCSSMTLFATVAPQQTMFGEAIRKYCNGKLDPLTILELAKL